MWQQHHNLRTLSAHELIAASLYKLASQCQLGFSEGAAADMTDASLCAGDEAYSMGLAVAREKLPALGSTPPLPNLEGGLP